MWNNSWDERKESPWNYCAGNNWIVGRPGQHQHQGWGNVRAYPQSNDPVQTHSGQKKESAQKELRNWCLDLKKR